MRQKADKPESSPFKSGELGELYLEFVAKGRVSWGSLELPGKKNCGPEEKDYLQSLPPIAACPVAGNDIHPQDTCPHGDALNQKGQ